MPEQQDLSRTGAKAGAQVSAGGRRRHASDLSANRLEARRQFVAAPVDRGRIVAGRFNRDERFDQFEQPVVIGEAIVEESVHRGLGSWGTES